MHIFIFYRAANQAKNDGFSKLSILSMILLDKLMINVLVF